MCVYYLRMGEKRESLWQMDTGKGMFISRIFLPVS